MNKEIEELLKGMRDVSNTEGCSMNLDRYLVKLLLSYIEQLENNRDKAIECIEKQKKKMYKSRNKIALFILMKLENILKGDSDNE